MGVGRDGGCDNGDGDADANALEMASEGGLTAVTTAETPAGTAVASAFAKVCRVGGGGRERRTAAPEQAGSGGGCCGGGGRNLDAYREPEGSDWKDLEDWHWQGLGLGLQTAGGKGEAEIRSRLQVSDLSDSVPHAFILGEESGCCLGGRCRHHGRKWVTAVLSIFRSYGDRQFSFAVDQFSFAPVPLVVGIGKIFPGVSCCAASVRRLSHLHARFSPRVIYRWLLVYSVYCR